MDPTVPAAPAYLVFDTESIPDGRLLALVKYAETTSLRRRRSSAGPRGSTPGCRRRGSDFVPVAFQYPVATCVLRVGADYRLQALTCLDAPQVSAPARSSSNSGPASALSREARQGGPAGHLQWPRLRSAADGAGGVRYGVSAKEHFALSRKRVEGWHLDLMEYLSSAGRLPYFPACSTCCPSCWVSPARWRSAATKFIPCFWRGKLQEINDYCMFDTLDTFLSCSASG